MINSFSTYDVDGELDASGVKKQFDEITSAFDKM
jgi:hypothetical protein